MAYHLQGLQPGFEAGDDWRASAQRWAQTLRGALLEHPNLYRLMTPEHRAPIVDYVNALLKVLLRAGFDEELALRACRVLVNVTISLTLSELKSPPASRRRGRSAAEIRFEDLVVARTGADPARFQRPPEVFENAIAWQIAGIEAEYTNNHPG